MIKVELYCPVCNEYRDAELNTYKLQEDVFIEISDDLAEDVMKCGKCGYTSQLSKRDGW